MENVSHNTSWGVNDYDDEGDEAVKDAQRAQKESRTNAAQYRDEEDHEGSSGRMEESDDPNVIITESFNQFEEELNLFEKQQQVQHRKEPTPSGGPDIILE